MRNVNKKIERTWKELMLAFLRYYSNICLEVLKNSTENLRVAGQSEIRPRDLPNM
jgi:hypothetical protein